MKMFCCFNLSSASATMFMNKNLSEIKNFKRNEKIELEIYKKCYHHFCSALSKSTKGFLEFL